MRILCIFGYASSAIQLGARILPLFQTLMRKGHTSTILTLDQDIRLTLNGKWDLKITPLKSHLGLSLYSELFLRARREILKQYDVLYTIKADFPSFFISCPLARIYHIPLVVDADDYETSPWVFRAHLKPKIMKFLLKKSKHLIVASKELYDFATTIRSGPITYIPNSADLKLFDPQLYRTRLSKEKVTLVWLGILYPFARWRFILTALAHTKSDFNVLVIGSGPCEDEFIHAAKKFRIWKRITMTGRVSQAKVPALLSKADVALLPLLNNAYDRCKCPIKLFEYIAMELPIICTDVGEPSYMVRKAGCGLISPPKPKKFAESIDHVVENIDYWRERGRQGRKYLERFQNWDLLSLRLKSALRSVYEDSALSS